MVCNSVIVSSDLPWVSFVEQLWYLSTIFSPGISGLKVLTA